MTTPANKRAVLHITKKLYLKMPGAPIPPRGADGYLWGAVEGNEHWQFCETLAQLIVQNSSSIYPDNWGQW